VLYATYTWTAAPGLSTLQAVRFYVPALGAISLGAWLLVRVPRRQLLLGGARRQGGPFRSPSTWQGGRRQVRIPY